MGNLILSIDVESALAFNRFHGEVLLLSLFWVLLIQIEGERVTYVDKYDQLLENQ